MVNRWTIDREPAIPPPNGWHGKGAEAGKALAVAIKANPHAVKYLLDPESLTGESPSSYRMGGEEEALIVAGELADIWQATPGAIDWLREVRREAKKAREVKRKGR